MYKEGIQEEVFPPLTKEGVLVILRKLIVLAQTAVWFWNRREKRRGALASPARGAQTFCWSRSAFEQECPAVKCLCRSEDGARQTTELRLAEFSPHLEFNVAELQQHPFLSVLLQPAVICLHRNPHL